MQRKVHVAMLYVKRHRAWFRSPVLGVAVGVLMLICGLLSMPLMGPEAPPLRKLSDEETAPQPVKIPERPNGEGGVSDRVDARVPASAPAVLVPSEPPTLAAERSEHPLLPGYAGIRTVEELEAQMSRDRDPSVASLLKLVRQARAGDSASAVGLAMQMLRCARQVRRNIVEDGGADDRGAPEEPLAPGSTDPCTLMPDAVLHNSLALLEGALAQGSQSARLAYGQFVVEATILNAPNDTPDAEARLMARIEATSERALEVLRESAQAGEPRALLAMGPALARVHRPDADGSALEALLRIEYAFALAAAQTGQVPEAQGRADELASYFDGPEALENARRLASMLTEQWQRGSVPALPAEPPR